MGVGLVGLEPCKIKSRIAFGWESTVRLVPRPKHQDCLFRSKETGPAHEAGRNRYPARLAKSAQEVGGVEAAGA
ncbi:conserved hypothetical protein [Ricinus communis]|uniref:Uncharacterized protein n=1 Tax=Ricinus communis TaxID=3988 RepID=B9TB22_RICCO|nr:conserved hypothetical protein [Ricinus communis]